MKNGLKTALVAMAAVSMIATPAFAGKISAPTSVGDPVNVVSSPNSKIKATVLGWVTADCHITIDGEVVALGSTAPTTPVVNGEVRFNSGTSTDIPPSTSCNSGPGGAGAVVYPMRAIAISPTVIRVARIELQTPVGNCVKTNQDFAWNNTTKIATLATTSAFPCTAISGSMYVPSLNIVAN